MISAIVLAPDLTDGEDTIHLAEVVVRSLAWLVSAVVAGVVRDVTLAAPAGLGLSDIADQAGCALVQADTEAERLAAAMATARCPLVLFIRTGFVPQAGLIEEIEDLVRHDPLARARILASSETLVERVLPNRAAAIGLVAPLDACRGNTRRGFGPLVRSMKGARPLRARAAAIG